MKDKKERSLPTKTKQQEECPDHPPEEQKTKNSGATGALTSHTEPLAGEGEFGIELKSCEGKKKALEKGGGTIA